MRKSLAFDYGKKDGLAGKPPDVKGGRSAYAIGYQLGTEEREAKEFQAKLGERHAKETTHD